MSEGRNEEIDQIQAANRGIAPDPLGAVSASLAPRGQLSEIEIDEQIRKFGGPDGPGSSPEIDVPKEERPTHWELGKATGLGFHKSNEFYRRGE